MHKDADMMRLWLLASALLISACASAPKPVGEAIKGSPGVAEALAQPARFQGERVRWGGVIVAVENQADATLVEVVARELDERGKPASGEASAGRFIARIKGFLDPEVYARGRRFTVSGTLDEPVTRTIGSYPYRYPVVNVDRHHLWERETVASDYRYSRPYYYDPFWDPWYPFYRPWPYSPFSPYW
jgi:outer membrane lipoprotein